MGEHEWVSPLTLSLKEEEVLAELDYEIGILCVPQWRFLWFTAPSRLNVKLDVEETRIAKCHEATNLAIEAAFNPPYGGRDTPRKRLLWLIAVVLDRLSDADWDLDKEMIGWTGRITCASAC